MTRDADGDGVADDQGDADLAGRETDQADVETDDDPQGMKGQLDDSMNGLESDDDVGEASRGIPQG